MIITIFSCRRPLMLAPLVESLEGSRIWIFDDHTLNPPGIPRATREAAEVFYQTERCFGRARHWRLWNLALEQLEETDAKLFVFLPDDCEVCDNFAERALEVYEKCPPASALTLWSLGKTPGGPNIFANHGEYVSGIHRSTWVDGCYICDRAFLERLGWALPVVPHSWTRSSGIGAHTARKMKRLGLSAFCLDTSLVNHLGHTESKMNTNHRVRHPLHSLGFEKGAR